MVDFDHGVIDRITRWDGILVWMDAALWIRRTPPVDPARGTVGRDR